MASCWIRVSQPLRKIQQSKMSPRPSTTYAVDGFSNSGRAHTGTGGVHDKAKKLYRVVTSRQKTGTHVSVPIPEEVAAELLAVLNGNARYVFWSGNGTEETVTKTGIRLFARCLKMRVYIRMTTWFLTACGTRSPLTYLKRACRLKKCRSC